MNPAEPGLVDSELLRAVRRGLPCPFCGYDLTNAKDLQCPECGSALSRRDFNPKEVMPRDRFVVVGLVGMSTLWVITVAGCIPLCNRAANAGIPLTLSAFVLLVLIVAETWLLWAWVCRPSRLANMTPELRRVLWGPMVLLALIGVAIPIGVAVACARVFWALFLSRP